MTRTRPLGLLDLPWVLLENRRHPMHVAGLLICRPPADAGPEFVDELARDLRRPGPMTDPFNRQLLRFGRGRLWPRWQTLSHVDLNRHVLRLTLPGPGDDCDLDRAVAALHRIPLDLSQPLWQLHIIDGLDRGRFAIYAKFHHSLVDGVGAIRVLSAALSTDPTAHHMPPIWGYRAGDRVRPRPDRRLRTTVLPRAMWAALVHSLGRDTDRPWSAPRSVLNTAISSERSVATHSVELTRLRRLATAMHGSVNDALLAVCGTALRRYLLELDALPRRSLTATMPVSVRPSDGADLGNAISFAFVSLATDVTDVRVRATRIMASTASAKRRLSRLPKHVVDMYTTLTMTPFVVAQLFGLGARTRPMFNVAVSNVPGPQERLFYQRASVLQIFPVSLLQSGQALNITALSYDGQLAVTVTACSASLPGIGRLVDCMADSLTALEAQFATPGRDAATDARNHE